MWRERKKERHGEKKAYVYLDVCILWIHINMCFFQDFNQDV